MDGVKTIGFKIWYSSKCIEGEKLTEDWVAASDDDVQAVLQSFMTRHGTASKD